MAAGDLHAVKLQLSGLFAELRDKDGGVDGEVHWDKKLKNDEQRNTDSIVELANAKTMNIFMHLSNVSIVLYIFLVNASFKG